MSFFTGRRLLFSFGGLLLALLLLLVSLEEWALHHPRSLVNLLLRESAFPTRVEKVTWANRHTLVLENLKIGPPDKIFFLCDQMVISWSWPALLAGKIDSVQVMAPQLYTDNLHDALQKMAIRPSEGLNWTISRLEIRRGTLNLNELGSAEPPIPIRFGVIHPVVLRDLQLFRPGQTGDDLVQTAEVENVAIMSPYDVVSPVFSFPLIRIRFTYQELWAHHLREISVTKPTIFLGQDLFWFADQFKKQNNASVLNSTSVPWVVEHFNVSYGQLAVNAFGQPALRFPFFFATTMENIRLNQLDKISTNNLVAIERLDKDYPEYGISVKNLRGRLQFSLPLSDPLAKNVVQTVYADALSWNKIPVTDFWSNLTYDENGIYGKIGGVCEGGALSGNFEIYYAKGIPWNLDFFAKKINAEPLTQKLVPNYFVLIGQTDGEVRIQGKSTVIEHSTARLDLTRPGQMRIGALDTLLDKLPGDWTELKRNLAMLVIETFRLYPYQKGLAQVDYRPTGATATLHLQSPQGNRNFEVYWHPTPSSKVANNH